MTTTILLVDNDPGNISVLSMGLQDEGFRVDAYSDSNFKPNFYSLSILDINKSNMNGYEFYRAIKKIDTKIKICFLTVNTCRC